MSRGPEVSPGAKAGASSAGGSWGLARALGVVLAAALFVWAWSWTGPLAVILLVLFTIAMVVGASFMAIRGRDSQRYALLWMLAIAADHRMPLATSVEAFAGQYRGGFRRRVVRLAELLSKGTGLSVALRQVPGLMSAETAMMVEVGEENDRLGESLRRAAAQQSERSTASQELASQMSYLGIVLLIGQGIVFFILYFIMPKFEAIFNDFGVELPAVTRAVIRTAHYLSSSFMIVPLLTLAAAFAFLSIPWMSADGAASWLPAGSSRRRHAALILQALAMTAKANRPIEAGLHTLALRYPSCGIRRRVAAAEEDVRRGVDWREALLRRGLIRTTDREALTSAQAVGNLPWAMNDLADAALRRANLRRALVAQALWPIIVGMVGVVVGVLALAFFMPLVELIGRLS
ncbi:type II secretion system F family protein [Paludisphaera sp.]|uniref:type II secretion system F family protein n=1 Tax=Paludisphaera sp. TaxID=2017432 RepID=UPI00301CD593